MIHTQICVRKTPDSNNKNSNVSFICMTISSFKINLQLILVNQGHQCDLITYYYEIIT